MTTGRSSTECYKSWPSGANVTNIVATAAPPGRRAAPRSTNTIHATQARNQYLLRTNVWDEIEEALRGMSGFHGLQHNKYEEGKDAANYHQHRP